MLWRGQGHIPVRVTVRQADAVATFVVDGAGRVPGLRIVIADRRGDELVIPAVDGSRFDVRLDDLAERGSATWEVTLRANTGRVAWEDASWRWERPIVWGMGAGSAVVTAQPGSPPRVVIVTGDASLPVPRVADVSVRSTRAAFRFRARVAVPPHLPTTLDLDLIARGGTDAVSSAVLVERLQAPGPCAHVRASAGVPWAAITDQARHDLFDVWLRSGTDTTGAVRFRVPGPRRWRRLRPQRSGHVNGPHGVTWLVPRRTLKARVLAIYAHTLPHDTARALARETRAVTLRRWFRGRGKRPLWLIGEVPYKAQDTGVALFAHLAHAHPEIDARYVIAADSPDRSRAEAIGPVVLVDTPEHAAAAVRADRIIGSHHPDYLFPLRTAWMRRRVKAPRVFLQHGVMGVKWMAGLYARDASGFDADQVHVSSPRERDLLIRDFGYRERQVAVTGLTRFDALLRPSEPSRRALIIPTWREWILSDDQFADSRFFAEWRGLCADPRLRAAIGDRELVLMLHPNMRTFASRFAANGVRIIVQGEEPLQEVLRSSELVVTDYSSVGFDAAILGRPVVYFQFDRKEFLGRNGSHLDLDVDLPGVIAVTRDAAIAAIAQAAEAGMAQSDAHRELAATYYPAHDGGASERAVEAIRRARRPHFAQSRRRARTVRVMATRTVERSRLTRPATWALLAASRVLALRDDLVVFEAERGRTYSGSPRAVYRELLRAQPDMTKVWATASGIPDADARTQRTVPGSLAHAWALGRARYWVSDQSQRPAVHRRRGQVFVQTWHGTPLKRMAHDAIGHEGRDVGYLQRATDGAKEWSVLVSANPHSTAAMATAFTHSAEVLEVGSPRNDVLSEPMASAVRERMRRALGAAPDTAVVLFAPTFRDAALGGHSQLAPTEFIDFEHFHNEFGGEALLLVRRHFLDTVAPAIPEHIRRSVIDVTSFPDASELLAAADVLVTDYSSVFFDFLITGRPMVFFAPDLEQYRDTLRGLYFDEVPGPVTRTYSEFAARLHEAIAGGTGPGVDLDAWRRAYCPHDDGAASRRVVAAVFERAAR